ncbi:MAG: hypothetical protein KDB01_23345 [Planctomycetaceae bacterium]|nr:hypothetical protein [Planctomycetaceae bacterium]
MGRRSQTAELGFGSDSFLDVICNIVGILIILIVIVAVKVERQPNAQAEAAASAENVAPAISEREAEYARRQADLEDIRKEQSRVTQRIQELADRKLALQRDHGQVQDEIAALQQQLEERAAGTRRTTAAVSEAEQEAESLTSDVNRLLNILAGKEQTLANAITVIEQEESEAAATQQTLQQVVVETAQLQEVLDAASKTVDTQPRLVHRIMPVSRRTDGEEVMFRMIEGKISEVPLNELMKLAVDRVRKRISMLQRFGRLEDVVGPVGGYRMTFSIEMNAFNSLEYLQYGGDGGRFTAFRQVIVPDETLQVESANDAVKPGSVFRQRLEAMPADSAVTIVVYDDSFAEFAALREVAHGLQIRVAARPLPIGTDITISANGSASRAQ